MKNQNKRSYILCIGIVASFLISIVPFMSASADTDKADLSVAMKVLPLLDETLPEAAGLAVVFNPGDDASKQEAEKIKTILGEGIQVPGGLKLTSILVPANDLSKITNNKIVVLTSGLSAYYNAISNAVAGRNVLTLSTDLECVKKHECILGIVSKPHVEIYYSKEAAEKAKIRFGQVFALLVKEI